MGDVASPPDYKPPRFPKDLLRRYKKGDRFLVGTTLDGTDLEDVTLRACELNDSSFCEANLLGVDFSESKLCGANLSFANLGEARLVNSDLRDTRFLGADLFYTELSGADLTGACFGRTALCGLDLRQVTGLDLTQHRFPSFLSTDTLARSRGQLPEVFLVGCGLSDWEIEAAQLHRPDLDAAARRRVFDRTYELRERNPIRTRPVFVCHADADDPLASEIAFLLQQHGVRCWRHLYGCEPGSTDGEAEGDRWMRRDGLSIVVVSEAATRGAWLLGELAYARKHGGSLAEHIVPVTLGEGWQRAEWDRKSRDELAALDGVEVDGEVTPETIGKVAEALVERVRELSGG